MLGVYIFECVPLLMTLHTTPSDLPATFGKSFTNPEYDWAFMTVRERSHMPFCGVLSSPGIMASAVPYFLFVFPNTDKLFVGAPAPFGEHVVLLAPVCIRIHLRPTYRQYSLLIHPI